MGQMLNFNMVRTGMKRWLIGLFVVLAVWQVADAQAPPFGGEIIVTAGPRYVRASAVASHTHATAGQTIHVALDMRIKEGWVYYSPDPGGQVLAAEIKSASDKLKPGEPLWPVDEPHEYKLGDETFVNNAYEDRAIVYVPVTIPAETPAGEYMVTLQAGGQVCGEGKCISLDDNNAVLASALVNVASQSIANPAWQTDADIAGGLESAVTAGQLRQLHEADGVMAGEASKYGLWAGIALALLAGLTLNIMPCVLPIIPLRIMSLVNMASQSRRRYITLGLAFAMGIVLFFAALGLVNVVLKNTASGALDINEHFKYEAVRIAIAMVLLALAANLFGLFNVVVPSRVAAIGQEQKTQGHLPAVGMGFMMAVLATPCSFWLMALSLGWAQLQPLWLGTLAIVLIGVGMAAPHIVLASFPALANKLPKPGRWMELFKQSMGFLLLPAVLYLLSTLTEDSYPFRVAGFGVVLVFGLWVWGTWVRYDAPLKKKILIRGIVAGLVVLAGFVMLAPSTQRGIEFEDFSQTRLAGARQQGRVVLVKVTARWCTSCKVLDYTVFNTPEAADAIEARNVIALKADVSDSDSAASRWVKDNFHTGPPLTIIYPPEGKPVYRVGTFSKEEFIEWLDENAEQ